MKMSTGTAEPRQPEAIGEGASPSGRAVQVSGSVVDIAFKSGALPPINNALEVVWDGPHRLIVEVQQHLDAHTIRGVAMQETAGLQIGVAVRDTGAPILVPTGEAVLGRMINVVGEAIDHGADFGPVVPREPIHRNPPKLAEQRGKGDLFLTGIKIIDLLAPLARGGKAAMFGGWRASARRC